MEKDILKRKMSFFCILKSVSNAHQLFFMSYAKGKLRQFLTGDRLPIIRNAVSVESNRNAILLEFPPEMPSVNKNRVKLKKL